MFQAADLQNLSKFGHREGHHFEFQTFGEWKSMKYQNEAGPTCQSQQPIKPLAPDYQLPSRARATTVGHAPEARAPPATRSTPCSALRCPRALAVLIHCRPWAVIEANPLSPPREALLPTSAPLLPLCSSHRHTNEKPLLLLPKPPTIASLVRLLPPWAKPSSSRSSKHHRSEFRRSLPSMLSTVGTSLPWPSSGQAVDAALFTWAPSSSPTRPTAPATPSPTPHCQSLPAKLCHCGIPLPGKPCSAPTLKIEAPAT
jgi:hypothetical protein